MSLPDLDPNPEPTLIPVPIDFEHEPPILDSHIPLLENECEFQFFDLDQISRPASQNTEYEWVRDDGQQILTKSEISSISTLGCQ